MISPQVERSLAGWISRGRTVDTIVSRSVIAMKSGLGVDHVAAAQRHAWVGLTPEQRAPIDPPVVYVASVCAVCQRHPVDGSWDLGDDQLCPDCRSTVEP
jgi:hypothetical protein